MNSLKRKRVIRVILLYLNLVPIHQASHFFIFLNCPCHRKLRFYVTWGFKWKKKVQSKLYQVTNILTFFNKNSHSKSKIFSLYYWKCPGPAECLGGPQTPRLFVPRLQFPPSYAPDNNTDPFTLCYSLLYLYFFITHIYTAVDSKSPDASRVLTWQHTEISCRLLHSGKLYWHRTNLPFSSP